MNVEQAQAWLPVVRDYTLLIVGVGLAVYGLVANSTAIASTGFGMAGMGAAGRAITNGKKEVAKT